MSLYASGQGRLTRDPEVIDIKDGIKIVKFCIATDRFYKRKDEDERGTDFFDVACFVWENDKSAQIDRRLPNLHKGQLVTIFNAEVQINKWQDNEGNNRERPQLVIRSLWDVKYDPRALGSSSSGPGTADSEEPPF